MAGKSDLGTLLVSLALNSAKFVTGIDNVNRKLDRFGKNAQAVGRIVGGAFAGFTLVNIGREITATVDKYKLMEGRLKLVARENENLAMIQNKLFNLSQKTRQDTEATTSLYTKLARATKDLNLDQEILLRTTESINKAVVISGVNNASAAAAIFQLQQGLAAGALRGQELNSVLEQTPRLAEAIADGMGITIGQLRKYGEEGKLTAAAVIQALTNQAKKLDEEFSSVPLTVAQNMQILTNEWERAAQAAGGFNKIVNATITSLANWLSIYNKWANPDLRKQLDNELEKRQKLIAVLEAGGYQGKKLIEQKKQELQETEKTINRLNERLLLEQQIEALRIKSSTGKVSGGSESEEQKKRIENLSHIEQLIRNNLSVQEKATFEIMKQNALYLGGITSVEAYGEALNKAFEAWNKPKSEVKRENDAERIANQEMADLQQSLMQLEEYYATREEREIAASLRRQDIIEDAFQTQQITQKRYYELMEQEAERHAQALADIEWQKTESILNSTASLFGSLASIVGRGSKKQFELSKKLARAETIVNTYTAAQNAYTWASRLGGPVAGAAAAAAALAAGFARLAAINRTSFNAANAASSASGAGTYTATDTNGPVTTNGSANGSGNQIFIIMSGSGDVAQLPDLQIQSIANQLRDQISNNDLVVITRDSRQAAEIAEAAVNLAGVR